MKGTAEGVGPAGGKLDLEPRFRKLRWWNLIVGLVLAVQAVIIAVLQNGFSIPVVATWLNGPPGTTPETHQIGSFKLGWGVFAFMALSALALLLVASPGIFGGVRSAQVARQLLLHLGCHVIPAQCTLPHADGAFDAAGVLKDPRTLAAVQKVAAELVRTTTRLLD